MRRELPFSDDGALYTSQILLPMVAPLEEGPVGGDMTSVGLKGDAHNPVRCGESPAARTGTLGKGGEEDRGESNREEHSVRWRNMVNGVMVTLGALQAQMLPYCIQYDKRIRIGADV